jgi:CheY-like chemotaxis protein
MDLKMPVMGGVQAIQAIRGQFPSAKVIVCPPMKAMKTSIARSKPAPRLIS